MEKPPSLMYHQEFRSHWKKHGASLAATRVDVKFRGFIRMTKKICRRGQARGRSDLVRSFDIAANEMKSQGDERAVALRALLHENRALP